jgi:hypothetical protein
MALDHTYLMRLEHINLSLANDSVGQNNYSREKGIPDYIPSTLADQSVGLHPVSLPVSTKDVVEKEKYLSTAGY